MSQPTHPLICTLDRLEGSKAVLRFSFNNNRQELILPKNLLPSDSKEGAVLSVEFLTAKQASKRQKNLAREILQEILSGGK